jgi:precorrin-6B C5,15-methyltransferase / cobalt-precorrin-6B C5,C15-methyltransferase
MSAKIAVIGLTAGGAASVPPHLVDRILGCDLLVGGARHLSYFPQFTGETLTVANNIPVVLAQVGQAHQNGDQVVVLASGDPLCYGIGSTLRRQFDPNQLDVIPAPSAFQLAFAALAEPWSDALLLSAHGRALPDVISRLCTTEKAAVLTDSVHRPQVIAQALLESGVLPESVCAVCENLGSEQQRVVRLSVAEAACHAEFAALNVFVVWNAQPRLPLAPGLPDDAFTTAAGQITKREVRLLTLAELGLSTHQVMWDVGAGSGAVSIEAARAQPTAQVFAIEKRDMFCDYIQENRQKLRAPNVCVIAGTAPAALYDLPDPHAVFIGGSGGYMQAILEHTLPRLHPGGSVVLNLVTLESLANVRQNLPTARVNQVQIQRGKPIADALRFEALNPVFVVTWQKETE